MSTIPNGGATSTCSSSHPGRWHKAGRLQDTLADKLRPRWLVALAEKPGSHIEVLNRAERLGVIEDVARWLEARQLRNRLVHEYITDSDAFAKDLELAEAYSRMLVATLRRPRDDASTRLGLPADRLPGDIG